MQDRPYLEPHLNEIWGAFLLASSCRPQNGWVIARLPLSEIEALMRLHEVDDPDDREEWLYLVARLDAELVKIKLEEDEKRQAAEKARAGRHPRGTRA